MKPEEFIEAYAAALATQNWSTVDPLISDNAAVTFSDGTRHLGKLEIEKAFRNNFEKIKSEKYSIDKVNWLKKEKTYAVYLFEYNWTGIVNDELLSGNGIGTSIISKEGDTWKLLSEHLGKKPS